MVGWVARTSRKSSSPGLYSGNTSSVLLTTSNQGLVLSNQRSVFRSRDQCCPIDQYSGHVTCIDKSEVSIQYIVLSNHRSVFRSRDKYWQIRGHYSSHMTSIDQSQASIYLHGLVPVVGDVLHLLGRELKHFLKLSLANQSPVRLQLTNQRSAFTPRPLIGQYMFTWGCSCTLTLWWGSSIAELIEHICLSPILSEPPSLLWTCLRIILLFLLGEVLERLWLVLDCLFAEKCWKEVEKYSYWCQYSHCTIGSQGVAFVQTHESIWKYTL